MENLRNSSEGGNGGLALSRDLAGAKLAYSNNDVEASKIAHAQKNTNLGLHGKEPHQGATGDYIQAVVFGGLDGIITTFAVIIAAAASKLTYGSILIIGFANLLADALGMGVGDYLSSKAESDHAESEKLREKWEIENMPEVEKKEMVDIYMSKGLTKEDATEVVELLFQSKEAFLDVMMIEELGLIPEESGISAWKGSIITFTSFLILGGLPMLPYLVSGIIGTVQNKHSKNSSHDHTHATGFQQLASVDAVFWSSIGVFAFCLYLLGAYKGKITGKRWYITGMTMLINGGVTTALAYLVGWLFERYL